MVRQAIPFLKSFAEAREMDYIAEALASGHFSGDGPFTKRCHAWLEERTGTGKALLTHSCTASLEMAALALDLKSGDEVIMPSFTFTSTANAVALRGATPVFVDIREDTLNLDERLVEEAITDRTRAILPVHYAGVGCEMDEIMRIAGKFGLAVVEDAAQCVDAKYKGRPLGAIGDLGCFSFHQTKNIVAGEGGALLVNRRGLIADAEIIREKGTDRSRFLRGEADKYTWRALGSSYLPGELVAAFLLAQLERTSEMTAERMRRWNNYHLMLQPLEREGLLSRPSIPEHCAHNAHIYYVLLADGIDRAAVLARMRQNGVSATFHYVPLHDAPAAAKYCRSHGDLRVTDRQAGRLVRLPLWHSMAEDEQAVVVEEMARAVKAAAPGAAVRAG